MTQNIVNNMASAFIVAGSYIKPGYSATNTPAPGNVYVYLTGALGTVNTTTISCTCFK
jgi:hypothetical protein